MNLPTIAVDKANHFVYGAGITALVAVVNIPAAILACCVLAIAKEVRDAYTGTGDPSYADVIWTLFGGATVLVPRVAHVLF